MDKDQTVLNEKHDKKLVKAKMPIVDKRLLNINNKDLLIVSLLEYVCNLHDRSNIFTMICEYLKDNGVIDKKDVYSLNSSHLREIYIKMITTLVSPAKQIEYNNSNPDMSNISNMLGLTDSSRYKSDYIEIECLGKGGFGSVFKCFNKIDQNLYAIKKVPIKKLNDEKSNYYLNEVRHLSMLNHQNIVRYYTTWIEFNNYIENDEHKIIPTLYIQMELCSVTLCDYLENRNYQGISQEDCQDEAMEIFTQIVKGVSYIHSQGIIHRDLSTKNIFLNDKAIVKNIRNRLTYNDEASEDEGFDVKIGDFGLSRKNAGDELKDADDSYGNFTYMAPEEMNDFQFSHKSDVYSLGIIYLELVYPFKTLMERAIIIQSLRDKEWDKFNFISKESLDLIKKMTDDDYNKRPNIDEVYDQLLGI